MKTLVLKENLQAALMAGERICIRSSSLPILNALLLSTHNNFLEIQATDLEVGLHFSVLSKNEEEGSVAIPAKALSQYLSFIKERQLSLETHEQGLRLAGNEFSASLKILNKEDFPAIPSLNKTEPSFFIETRALCKGIASIVGFVSQAQIRPEISGVLFLVHKNTLRLVATDSFRLGEKTLHLEKEGSIEGSAIVPAKTCVKLVSILGELPGDIRVSFSSTLIVFTYTNEQRPELPTIELVSRVIDGEYPNYEDVIPTKHETVTVFDKRALSDQLKAASLFANKTNEVKIFFDQKNQHVSLNAKNIDAGEHTSVVKAVIEGAPQEISFNWRFLLEGISHIEGDAVEFLLAGPENPAVLKPKNQEGYLYVAMPIKA